MKNGADDLGGEYFAGDGAPGDVPRKNPISVQMPAAPLRGENESHDPRARAPLPIGERVGADTRFTGRGVVAPFLDSGFFAHPDLTTPHSRIHAYHDLIHGKD